MNINSIIETFIRILCFSLFFTASSIFAQINSDAGRPFVENITPHQTGFRNKNFTIVQDSRGFIYVGNTNGILEYDGQKWTKIDVAGNPMLHSSQRGEIFVGAYNQFGYLKYRSFGKAVYESLSDSLSYSGGQIRSVAYAGNEALMATENTAYLYNGSLHTLMTDSVGINVFKAGTRRFVFSESKGLFIYNKQRLDTLPETRKYIGAKILGLIPFRHTFATVLEGGIFIFDKDGFRPVLHQISKTASEYGFNVLRTLSNNGYALGTKYNGVYIFSPDGKLLEHINSKNGLYNNSVNDIFADSQNNLWLALDNGIARVEYPSPFSYYSESDGLEGTVLDIIRYNDTIYAGTTGGMFKLSATESGRTYFEPYRKIQAQCNKFALIGDQLMIAASTGLYSLKDGVLTQHLYTKTDIVRIGRYTNRIYAVKDNLLKIFRFDSDTLKRIVYIKDIESPITSIAEENGSAVWVGTKFENVFQLTFSEEIEQNYSIRAFRKNSGLPDVSKWVDVYPSSKGPVFSTFAGLYRFDENIDRFYRDHLIDIAYNYPEKRVKPLVEDDSRNLWFAIEKEGVYENRIASAWNIEKSKRYAVVNQPFMPLNDFVCNSIYPDGKLFVWFGGYEGIVCLDFKSLVADSLEARTFIRSIIINGKKQLNESDISYGFNKEITLELSHSENSIEFEFVAPFFQKRNKMSYQCKLEGFDADWLELTTRTKKEYTSLPPGNYRFHVKAKNVYGYFTKTETVSFTILAPFWVRWWAITAYAILIIMTILIVIRLRMYAFAKEKFKLEQLITKRTEELLQEKEKTERLLANILPERTVRELKDKGRASSMRFDMVTVLFSDIQGFTRIAEQLNPDKLVDELDRFFLTFDNIVDKYNIEKIKTIGDAYMCAGGIPQKNRSNPIEVVISALEIQYQINLLRQQAHSRGEEYWGLRIGIHTGPVVAGVIGSKKYTYDIWGDTVNIASRMESSGEVGKVNVSEDTYILIKQCFDCEYRGKMPVKYKGDIDMYFVKGFKADLCGTNLSLPNDKFLDKLSLLRYEDLDSYILDLIEEKLPKNLYYHDLKHTIDVIVNVEIIGNEEGVNDHEMVLLKTAALFHDLGFIEGYEDHEVLGIQLANKMLPQFRYSEADIKIIGDLIYSTRLPQTPKTKLEQIICDADLDYLGRSDYVPVSRNLFKELVEFGFMKQDELAWLRTQVRFLSQHKYHTNTAKRRRNKYKLEQLQLLKKQLKNITDEIKENSFLGK